MVLESLVVDMVRGRLFVCDLTGDGFFDDSCGMLIGAWSVVFVAIFGED